MDKETQIKTIGLILDNPANILTTTSIDLLNTLRTSIEADIEPEVDTKTAKISRIKEIIGEWGETTTAELMADHSPCISSIGNRVNTSVLVERFGLHDVGIFTYVGDVEESEDDLTYEELEEDVIDDILNLLEDYDTDNFKTMQRCQD
jgi:hypothetical protein